MTTSFEPGVGAVQSADIAVPDHKREGRFYARVLGTGDPPLWRNDLMNNLGRPIIGLGKQTPAYAHLPLQWMPHIQVADVAASAERTSRLGGSELLHSKDGKGSSQWAVLQDPNGAAFGIIPEVPGSTAADSSDTTRVGYIRRVTLTVPDASTTAEFYREVVGWSVQSVELGDTEGDPVAFDMLAANGTVVASIADASNAAPGMPRVWLLHLPVGDLDESLRRVQAEDGEVIGTFSAPDGSVQYAVVMDPVGVYVALVPG